MNKPTTKPFALTQAIKARKALRFKSRYLPLTLPQRFKLGKAEKSIRAAFATA